MQRFPQIDQTTTIKDVDDTFNAVKAQLGMVPNIFKTMAHAPAVLNGYLALSGALGKGKLSPALREQIALMTAGVNACDYCASAHSALGKMAGLSADEIRRNLTGTASDAKSQAALSFARKLVVDRGVVSDADLDAVKAAGFSNTEILEIFGNTMVNIFTNYFNHLAATDIDFPKVAAKPASH